MYVLVAVTEPDLRSSSPRTSDVILSLLIALVCILLVTCVTLTTVMCRRERELEMEEENIIISDSAALSVVKTINAEQNNSRGLFVHPNWIKEVANIN